MSVPVQKLNRYVEVWRREFTEDSAGGRTATIHYFATVRTRILQPTEGQQTVAAQSGARLTHVAYFLPDTDVQRGDELRGDDQTIRVYATYVPSEPIYLRADCEAIGAEGG